jgi:hypothetical protein
LQGVQFLLQVSIQLLLDRLKLLVSIVDIQHERINTPSYYFDFRQKQHSFANCPLGRSNAFLHQHIFKITRLSEVIGIYETEAPYSP